MREKGVFILGKKLSGKLKGEIVSSAFYILFGLCLAFFTEQTMYVICKVIFGLVMLGTGIYHICIYVADKEKATILDMFTGVIVLVLGGFLFLTPQVIVKLLPYFLSAFVLVDSIWTLKGAWKLKKLENNKWKVLLIGSLVFAAAGIVIMVFPFSNIRYTAILAGYVMLANGIGDFVFLYLLRKESKEKKKSGDAASDMGAVSGRTAQEAGKYAPDAGETEETSEDEDGDVINGRWKNASDEETESPAEEIKEAAQADAKEAVTEEQTEQENTVSKNNSADDSAASETAPEKDDFQEEVLEEWKD